MDPIANTSGGAVKIGSGSKSAFRYTNLQYEPDSKIQAVQGQVDQVKTILTDNLSRAINRGDQLDDMEKKSQELAENAKDFDQGARRLNRTFCVRHAKCYLVGAVILLIVLLIILHAAGAF